MVSIKDPQLNKLSNDQLHATAQAKKLSKLFAVCVKISLFGVTIFEWHWPPHNDNSDE